MEGPGLLSEALLGLDPGRGSTPCFVISTRALRANLEILRDVQHAAGCKILLALKGFAAWSLADLIREYLPGVAASSPHEARLGREEFAGEVHTCAPAFAPDTFDEIVALSDHIIFNSFSEWQRHKRAVQTSGRELRCGIVDQRGGKGRHCFRSGTVRVRAQEIV